MDTIESLRVEQRVTVIVRNDASLFDGLEGVVVDVDADAFANPDAWLGVDFGGEIGYMPFLAYELEVI